MLLKRRKKKAKKTSTAGAQAGEDVVSSSGDAHASSPPKYKEDHSAFDTPVEEGEDYISQLPSELLESILSYCVLDHEPEAGAKAFAEGYNYRPRSHVLLSLAAMSRHFKAHVESFCQREMMKHKDDYRFKTNDELKASNRRRQVRRSLRLQSKPVEDYRCYRFEMVRYLQLKCIGCNLYCNEFAVMANAVQCCRRCQPETLGETINLTSALQNYDLRDWMLLPTREPGPRATKLGLPVIPYGTLKVTKPFMSGWMVSYRFFKKDVEAIAKIVHGDVESHMEAKRKKQVERRHKKFRETHRKLKLRYHRDELGDTKSRLRKLHHQKRIEHYESLDWDSDGDSAADETGYGYGDYGDEHEQFCVNKADCDFCSENAYRKYCPWW